MSDNLTLLPNTNVCVEKLEVSATLDVSMFILEGLGFRIYNLSAICNNRDGAPVSDFRHPELYLSETGNCMQLHENSGWSCTIQFMVPLNISLNISVGYTLSPPVALTVNMSLLPPLTFALYSHKSINNTSAKTTQDPFALLLLL